MTTIVVRHLSFSGYRAVGAALIALFTVSLLFSCRTGNKENRNSDPMFTLLGQDITNISFTNAIEYTEELNTYTYRNFYNGAGVGLGDFNNDNLTDIYFCGNQVGNRLYLNIGNFVFEDITENAGVACNGSWSTGVTVADLNGDSLADIYVCKSGPPGGEGRHNELFINNGDLTFTERSEEYGLAITGLSNHATFFDYDRDGDLDCYLLNNSFRSVTGFDLGAGQREIPDSLGANKLFRNDGGVFSDVTSESGIYSSKIGFGLGVSAADLNRDGWTDLYISNDFFERDYLYLNNKDGTFTENLTAQMREISLGAMGADIADLDNDTYPEVFTTEMTPEDNARRKTKALFDSWEVYSKKAELGYFYQFARNVLQLNNRNGSFSEIGRFSGVSCSDWSWGALISDFDNDGWSDIFIANGIFKDLLDRDYLDFYSDPRVMRSMLKNQEKAILNIIGSIPSVSIPNYLFHNNGDLTFTNLSADWGLATPSFSNGAAYGDLDNDGDMDLIVNNVNMPAFVYRNETSATDSSNFLMVTLGGSGLNTSGIGASVTIWHDSKTAYREQIPARGFMSCVDSRLHFGIGKSSSVDSLIVNWPDGRVSTIKNVPANQFVVIDQDQAVFRSEDKATQNEEPVFISMGNIPGLDFRHLENQFTDFDRDRLLFRMLSADGPAITIGDVNGDRLDDLFACGAKDQAGSIYIQDSNGRFRQMIEPSFESGKVSEETDCAFFDADSDGDQDLYIASGGNEFPSSSSALADRLLFNDGNGKFFDSGQILPAGKYECTSCVRPADFDTDGDMDLFVGIRQQPFAYGLPANGYILENDGSGKFNNVSNSKAPVLSDIGMITDMAWADIDGDGDQDMVIVGDWMPVRVLINEKGSFNDKSAEYGMTGTEGWWNVAVPAHLNSDGYPDFILGNQGTNSFFRTRPGEPLEMYVNDFDLNGSIEQIICTYMGGTSYPVVLRDDLITQIPGLASRYPSYSSYKDQTISDIFPENILSRSVVLNASHLENSVLINSGGKCFKISNLPSRAQFFPVYSVLAGDFDDDNVCDILLGGNQYRSKPEVGINDAGYGLFLKGKPEGGWEALLPGESGFFVKGEIRDLKKITINGRKHVAVALNNDNLMVFNY